MLNALFVLKMFKFLSWLLGYVEKQLDKKAKVNFRIYDVQQIITIYILLNILRSKDNKAMKFGQIIEYNLRNIFLQISYKRWNKETSSRTLLVFLKKA